MWLASLKLALQLNKRPIGIVDAPGQDRGDVNERERIFARKPGRLVIGGLAGLAFSDVSSAGSSKSIWR